MSRYLESAEKLNFAKYINEIFVLRHPKNYDLGCAEIPISVSVQISRQNSTFLPVETLAETKNFYTGFNVNNVFKRLKIENALRIM